MRSVLVFLLMFPLAVACGSDTVNGDAAGKDPEVATQPADSAGAATSSPLLPRTGDRRRLVFVGTSLTAGLGLDQSAAFPAIVQRKIDSAGLPYEVENAGLSGETSAGALRRVDWLFGSPADVVVLETGANDGLRGVEPDSVRANIARIIDLIRERSPGVRIILAGMEAPPNMGDRYVTAFREMYPELAREKGVTLIPFLLQGVAGDESLNQGDGIHPNEEGAELVAATVWSVLRGVLLERGRP